MGDTRFSGRESNPRIPESRAIIGYREVKADNAVRVVELEGLFDEPCALGTVGILPRYAMKCSTAVQFTAEDTWNFRRFYGCWKTVVLIISYVCVGKH
jgi:hypothetical protein